MYEYIFICLYLYDMYLYMIVVYVHVVIVYLHCKLYYGVYLVFNGFTNSTYPVDKYIYIYFESFYIHYTASSIEGRKNASSLE